MKKSLATTILLGMLTLAIAGCGGGDKKAEAPKAASKAPAVVQLKSEKAEALIPEAKKEGKVVTIVVKGDLDEAREKLLEYLQHNKNLNDDDVILKAIQNSQKLALFGYIE